MQLSPDIQARVREFVGSGRCNNLPEKGREHDVLRKKICGQLAWTLMNQELDLETSKLPKDYDYKGELLKLFGSVGMRRNGGGLFGINKMKVDEMKRVTLRDFRDLINASEAETPKICSKLECLLSVGPSQERFLYFGKPTDGGAEDEEVVQAYRRFAKKNPSRYDRGRQQVYPWQVSARR
jgi:hypothetical protein